MFGKYIRIEALANHKNASSKARHRIKPASVALFSLLAIVASQVTAQMYPPGGEGAPGNDMFQACGFCHGNQGQGRQRLDAPPIAALPAWYVERQMHNFIDEIRGNHPDDLPGHQMNLITPMFRNDATVKNVAAYIETLEPGGPPMTIGPPGNQRIEPRERPFDWISDYAFLDVELSSGNPENGSVIYQQNCVACHGRSAEGNKGLGSPPLMNLADWYVARQMQYFRDGVRGADSGDIYGAQMVPFAKLLTNEQQIADVAAYIKTLAP